VLAFVTAKNLHAKKFDAGQRAIIAARLRPFYDEQADNRKRELSGTRSNPGQVEEKIPQPPIQRLNASQRGMIGAALQPFYAEQAKRKQIDALKRGNETKHGGDSSIEEKIPQSTQRAAQARDEAGKAAGVNHAYVDQAAKIEKASPEVANQVLNGKMTLQEGLKQVAPIIAAVHLVTLAPLHFTDGTSFGTPAAPVPRSVILSTWHSKKGDSMPPDDLAHRRRWSGMIGTADKI
jgi:hypothetical protein